MANKIKAVKGFFGGTNHYDNKGRKVGHSEPSLFGGFTTWLKDKK